MGEERTEKEGRGGDTMESMMSMMNVMRKGAKNKSKRQRHIFREPNETQRKMRKSSFFLTGTQI